MRRLTGEDGAAAVLVAVMLLVLLGVAALVVDVGMIYQERRELQNAADAAATAIAFDCARAELGLQGPCAATAQATAGQYADANASDGAASVPPGDGVVIDAAARTVQVRARSQDADSGANALSLAFARAIGWDSMEVGADTTAAWGALLAGPAIPLTVSACETGGGPPYPSHDNADISVVFTHFGTGPDPVSECLGPAGQQIPGGFGWLHTPADTPCQPWIRIGDTGTATSSNGRVMPQNCRPATWDGHLAGAGFTVLLPIFDCVGPGTDPCDDATDVPGRRVGQWSYRVSGLARFHVHGYHLQAGGGAYHPDQATARSFCNNAHQGPGGGADVDCVWGHVYGDIVPVGDLGAGQAGPVMTVRLIE